MRQGKHSCCSHQSSKPIGRVIYFGTFSSGNSLIAVIEAMSA